jgi:periplasmic divalent cation tolerance protein
LVPFGGTESRMGSKWPPRLPRKPHVDYNSAMGVRMTTGSGIVLVYCPCGSQGEAVRIAGALLEQKLIACANITESQSMYYWKGVLSDETEWLLLCKTTSTRAGAVARTIRRLHSYEIPCVMRFEPAKVNEDYEKWVFGEVALDERPRASTGQTTPSGT